MTWYDSFTSPTALIAGLVGGLLFLYIISQKPSGTEKPSTFTSSPPITQPSQRRSSFAEAAHAASDAGSKPKMPGVMSAPTADLAPPKSDPIPVSTLRQHDGSDPAKPIYVAIKGNVYDVTAKKEMYGPGQGYNVFAGRDASRGLGMSSLEVKDAVADYSTLDDKQMKTLDHWESFFQKRYNIVGKVVP